MGVLFSIFGLVSSGMRSTDTLAQDEISLVKPGQHLQNRNESASAYTKDDEAFFAFKSAVILPAESCTWSAWHVMIVAISV
jgi:hypothetical protein